MPRTPSTTPRNTSPGKRGSDYLLQVKGNQPGLQRAIYDTINAGCGTAPDHVAVDYGYGRIIRRSIWVTGADGIDFPHAAQVTRLRRDNLKTPTRRCRA